MKIDLLEELYYTEFKIPKNWQITRTGNDGQWVYPEGKDIFAAKLEKENILSHDLCSANPHLSHSIRVARHRWLQSKRDAINQIIYNFLAKHDTKNLNLIQQILETFIGPEIAQQIIADVRQKLIKTLPPGDTRDIRKVK